MRRGREMDAFLQGVFVRKRRESYEEEYLCKIQQPRCRTRNSDQWLRLSDYWRFDVQLFCQTSEAEPNEICGRSSGIIQIFINAYQTKSLGHFLSIPMK